MALTHFLLGLLRLLLLSVGSSSILEPGPLSEVYLRGVFRKAEVVHFDGVPFTDLSFYGCCVSCQGQELFAKPWSPKVVSCFFFPESFVVLCFRFNFLIDFVLLFTSGVRFR